MKLTFFVSAILALFFPVLAGAAEAAHGETLDLTTHFVGYASIAIFVIAYGLVMAEEFLHLRKSKPVILAAGLIWAIIAVVYAQHGIDHTAEQAVRHNLLEYAELMLFLLVAMTYINAMEDRRIFDALRSWLVSKGYGFKQLFWMTGILAFFISPIADNLTTALLMCAVVMAVGGSNEKFVSIGCVNIVVAANAGGAFSPFGDITTLMVWQKGVIDFFTFFHLIIPSVVNFVVPASIMMFFIPNEKPSGQNEDEVMKRGAKRIIALFLVTIGLAVSFHNFLHLPPVIGMFTGLALLQFFGYYLKRTHNHDMSPADLDVEDHIVGDPLNYVVGEDKRKGDVIPFDVFNKVAKAEWDTLLFFYGVVLCVGGLGFIGYLSLVSDLMYTQWNPTYANIAIGLLSAIVDNIPVMFAVLTMMPEMTEGQWLLVTLTAGVGGSLLSIGSAAGVALMGMAKGKYTFFGHLKWTPVIALGYIASIAAHLWVNARFF
ncbi:Na(+)/H(+) antiporter NhaD [Thalassocella blandensis]|nr:Na(+)/H(+) antiporter NhaD [Thalassocella blandensis]